jgi:ribosomal-protein-alanine N-acetyltransferase
VGVRHLRTDRLTLTPATLDETRAALASMSVADRAQLSPLWLERVNRATADDPWVLGFNVVHRATGTTVGSCGFKGPPDGHGTVEIAYGIGPDHQNQGYATEAAARLVEFAFASSDVRVVCAHTIDAGNASARVLTKCGFSPAGQVDDPEDGLVWRWEKRRLEVC